MLINNFRPFQVSEWVSKIGITFLLTMTNSVLYSVPLPGSAANYTSLFSSFKV